MIKTKTCTSRTLENVNIFQDHMWTLCYNMNYWQTMGYTRFWLSNRHRVTFEGHIDYSILIKNMGYKYIEHTYTGKVHKTAIGRIKRNTYYLIKQLGRQICLLWFHSTCYYYIHKSTVSFIYCRRSNPSRRTAPRCHSGTSSSSGENSGMRQCYKPQSARSCHFRQGCSPRVSAYGLK